MCRDYPSTGFHPQADAEHRANATARAAWANPDALSRRPLTIVDEWAIYVRELMKQTAFSSGGVYVPPTRAEHNPTVRVTSWA